MSFRGRLAFFFVLIVVLPTLIAAVLVREVTSGSEDAKADAAATAGLETATSLYEQRAAEAESAGRKIASDPALGEALRAGKNSEGALRRLIREHEIDSVRLQAGGEAITVGSNTPVAPAQVSINSGTGRALATLTVAVTSAQEFVDEVARLTGKPASLTSDGEELASTPVASGTAAISRLPANGEAADATIGGEPARVVSTELPGPGELRVALFVPVGDAGFLASSPAVFAGLAVFFALAILLVMVVVRSLQGQVARMLAAARRIGDGDFSQKLPVSGRDELAGLADEFNKMSDRLAAQMDELRSQRVEIERSVQRIGAAFASGLDREALLKIVAETAVSACKAEYGLIVLSGREGAEAVAGEATDALEEAVLAAEASAERDVELSTVEYDGAHALSAPLRRIAHPTAVGAMSIARTGKPFGPAERDVFVYLVGQASASTENVALHEVVSEQAVTDDLTGLANKRSFTDFLDKEAARARRFSHDLSLLMFDIDDFKKVNDTYGHVQGDHVLRMVGSVLREESRGVDEPARYGGEEFAIALPETGTEGALELAERIRVQLESRSVPFTEGEGELRVTASIGVASIPSSARDADGLVAAADAALYAAKRGGKNRVASAGRDGERAADGGVANAAGEAQPTSKDGSDTGIGEGFSPPSRSPTAS